jgi:hypothetical protein
VFPGAVYNFAVFPTSLALAFVLGALVAAIRERFVMAALLMVGAGLCYPSAWFAAIGFAVALVAVAHRYAPAEQYRRGLFGLLGFGSLLVLVLISRPWNAFLLVNRQNRTGAVPGEDFVRLLLTQRTDSEKGLGHFYSSVLAVQGVVVVLLVAFAAVIAIKSWRSSAPDLSLVYPASVGIAVVLGVVALNTNGGACNRSVVLAAPCAVCLRRLPFAILCIIVVATGAVTAIMSSSFFEGRLV